LGRKYFRLSVLLQLGVSSELMARLGCISSLVQVTSEERSQTGASLVELYKEKQGNSVRLFKRKGNGREG